MTRFSALTIRRIVHALTIITLLTIMLSAAKTHTVTSVVKGIATTLSCTITAPDIPCHDQSLGQTVFEIKSKGAARPFGRIVLDERWQCAGFSSNGYVLLGFWETGSVVTLNGIRYWRESEKQPTISKFERDDSSAAAGTFSADLRFYAFVNMGGGLFILDLVRDDTRALVPRRPCRRKTANHSSQTINIGPGLPTSCIMDISNPTPRSCHLNGTRLSPRMEKTR
jgi:hypothetical protein